MVRRLNHSVVRKGDRAEENRHVGDLWWRRIGAAGGPRRVQGSLALRGGSGGRNRGYRVSALQFFCAAQGDEAGGLGTRGVRDATVDGARPCRQIALEIRAP